MKIYYTKNNNNTTIKYYYEKKEDRHYIHRLLIKKLKHNKKHFKIKKGLYEIHFNDTSKDYIRKVICECIKEDLQELQAKNKI